MKTIALILLLTCFGLWAQSPPTVTDTNDSAAKDEILRRAMRDAFTGTNAATGDKVSATTGTSPVPIAPQSQTVPPLKRPLRNLSTPVVETNAPAVTVVNAANPVIINTPTNSVVITAATNPVVLAAPPLVPVPVVPAATPVVVAPQPPPVNSLPGRSARAAATSAPQLPPAGAAQPPEQIIHAGEIDFPGVGVDQFLEFYAKLVGRTILRGPNLPAPQITLQTQTDLTKSEAIQAFESILAMNSIAMVNVGDKFVKAVPVGVVGQIGTPFSTNDASELAEVDKFVTEIVHIQNAKPSELVQVLAPYAQIQNNILAIDSSGMLIIRDYSVNVKRMMELIKQIDVLTPLEYESEVIPIKYAKASEISSALSSLGGNTSATIGSAPAGGGSRAGGFTPGGGATGTLGGGNGYNQPNAAGGLNGGQNSGLNGANRTSSFADRLKQLGLKSTAGGGGAGDFNILGTTKIIADERTNSLLVFASKQDLAMIKKIIKELDTVLAQVLIEAIIMEVTIDDTRNLGVSYLQKAPSQPGNYFSGIGAINNGAFLNNQNFSNSGTNGSGALPGGFSYLAHFGNDFDATLTAIATDNRIHVLSRPWIQTSHAVTATLKIGDTVPYVTGTYFGGINGQASSQYQQTFVGIDLEVTPLINPDGLVVMDITQDIQQLGTPTIIDNNPVPTTTQRSAQAKVSVRDGETIILGGFISSTKSKSKSGVPFLKDIPGLGYLFRSTSDSNKRVELIVLIRPTVLPNPESAALLATRKQNKLPGVKAALAEDRIDENKRLKAADSIKVPPERD